VIGHSATERSIRIDPNTVRLTFKEGPGRHMPDPALQPANDKRNGGPDLPMAIWTGKGLNMPTRTAHARWKGTIKEGKGSLDFGNGAFQGAYSFGSRFEDGAGTNPEELLGAAHAGCFAMALSLVLGKAGFTPDYIDATAHVTVEAQDGGFKITKSHTSARRKCRA
jgi:lipoyl-dependent peroxiredoxin